MLAFIAGYGAIHLYFDNNLIPGIRRFFFVFFFNKIDSPKVDLQLNKTQRLIFSYIISTFESWDLYFFSVCSECVIECNNRMRFDYICTYKNNKKTDLFTRYTSFSFCDGQVRFPPANSVSKCDRRRALNLNEQ